MIRLQTFIANIQIIYETDLFYKDLTCCLVLTRSRGWKRSVEQVPLKMFPITISNGWQGWSYPYRLSFNLYLSDPARKAFVTGLSWDTASILKSSLFLSIFTVFLLYLVLYFFLDQDLCYSDTIVQCWWRFLQGLDSQNFKGIRSGPRSRSRRLDAQSFQVAQLR